MKKLRRKLSSSSSSKQLKLEADNKDVSNVTELHTPKDSPPEPPPGLKKKKLGKSLRRLVKRLSSSGDKRSSSVEPPELPRYDSDIKKSLSSNNKAPPPPPLDDDMLASVRSESPLSSPVGDSAAGFIMKHSSSPRRKLPPPPKKMMSSFPSGPGSVQGTGIPPPPHHDEASSKSRSGSLDIPPPPSDELPPKTRRGSLFGSIPPPPPNDDSKSRSNSFTKPPPPPDDLIETMDFNKPKPAVSGYVKPPPPPNDDNKSRSNSFTKPPPPLDDVVENMEFNKPKSSFSGNVKPPPPSDDAVMTGHVKSPPPLDDDQNVIEKAKSSGHAKPPPPPDDDVVEKIEKARTSGHSRPPPPPNDGVLKKENTEQSKEKPPPPVDEAPSHAEKMDSGDDENVKETMEFIKKVGDAKTPSGSSARSSRSNSVFRDLPAPPKKLSIDANSANASSMGTKLDSPNVGSPKPPRPTRPMDEKTQALKTSQQASFRKPSTSAIKSPDPTLNTLMQVSKTLEIVENSVGKAEQQQQVEQHKELTSDNSSLLKQINQLESELNQLKAVKNKRDQEVLEDLNRMKTEELKRLNNIKKTVDELEAKGEGVRSTLMKAAQQHKSAAVSRLNRAKLRFKRVSDELANLQQKNKSIRSTESKEITATKSQITVVKSSISALESDIESLALRNAQLEVHIQETEADYELSKTELDALRTKFDKEKALRSAPVAKLQKDIEVAKESLRLMQENADKELNTVKQELEEQRQLAISNTSKDAEAANNELRMQTAEFLKKKQKLSQQKEIHQKILREANIQCKALGKEFETLKVALSVSSSVQQQKTHELKQRLKQQQAELQNRYDSDQKDLLKHISKSQQETEAAIHEEWSKKFELIKNQNEAKLNELKAKSNLKYKQLVDVLRPRYTEGFQAALEKLEEERQNKATQMVQLRKQLSVLKQRLEKMKEKQFKLEMDAISNKKEIEEEREQRKEEFDRDVKTKLVVAARSGTSPSILNNSSFTDKIEELIPYSEKVLDVFKEKVLELNQVPKIMNKCKALFHLKDSLTLCRHFARNPAKAIKESNATRAHIVELGLAIPKKSGKAGSKLSYEVVSHRKIQVILSKLIAKSNALESQTKEEVSNWEKQHNSTFLYKEVPFFQELKRVNDQLSKHAVVAVKHKRYHNTK